MINQLTEPHVLLVELIVKIIGTINQSTQPNVSSIELIAMKIASTDLITESNVRLVVCEDNCVDKLVN